MPEIPLTFQGDPGKGCKSPREVELKTGYLPVLAGQAAEINVSFVPLSPGRWRELGQAGGADTAHCAHASLTAPGLGTESCRLTNPLRACCKQLGSQHEQPGYLGKAVSFQREGMPCPASRIKLCVTMPRLKDTELQVSKVTALSSRFLGWFLTLSTVEHLLAAWVRVKTSAVPAWLVFSHFPVKSVCFPDGEQP